MIQNNRPIYLQIADRLMDNIAAGIYPPEGRIPSVRETAADAQVNVNTVMRTFEALERDGIIYNRRGLGYFVTPEAAARIRSIRRSEFESGTLDFFFSRLKSMEITPGELAELYSNYLKK